MINKLIKTVIKTTRAILQKIRKTKIYKYIKYHWLKERLPVGNTILKPVVKLTNRQLIEQYMTSGSDEEQKDCVSKLNNYPY